MRAILLAGLAGLAAFSLQAQSRLPGSYTAGPITLEFDSAGYRISRGGQLAVTGEYRLSADTITFQDLSGAIACTPASAGRYLWQRSDTALTFTLVTDSCPGRRGAIPGRPWMAEAAGRMAFTGVTLIDGTGSPPRSGMTVVIADGKIVDLFADGSRPLPPGTTGRGLPGRYLIPGLIDTHVHLATDPSGGDARRLVEDRLRMALQGGVTSVRDMAGDARALADLARAARVGDIVSPYIYYSAILAGPEFFADPRVLSSSRGEKPGAAPWARAVTAESDWRQVMAEARGTGATGIKVYAAVGAEVMAPLVAEAHRQGLKVWAHAAPIPARPRDMVAAGVDVLSHAPLLAREADTSSATYLERYRAKYDSIAMTDPALRRLLDAMAAKATIVEPTLFVFANRDSTSPPTRWAGLLTRELHRRGITLVAGTDGIIGIDGGPPAPPGTLPNLHRELELLVRLAGLTPHEAILAATRNAARGIGIESEAGMIAPGMRADLVVLTKDPLADIRNTTAIDFVMRNGAMVEKP